MVCYPTRVLSLHTNKIYMENSNAPGFKELFATVKSKGTLIEIKLMENPNRKLIREDLEHWELIFTHDDKASYKQLMQSHGNMTHRHHTVNAEPGWYEFYKEKERTENTNPNIKIQVLDHTNHIDHRPTKMLGIVFYFDKQVIQKAPKPNTGSSAPAL